MSLSFNENVILKLPDAITMARLDAARVHANGNNPDPTGWPTRKIEKSKNL